MLMPIPMVKERATYAQGAWRVVSSNSHCKAAAWPPDWRSVAARA